MYMGAGFQVLKKDYYSPSEIENIKEADAFLPANLAEFESDYSYSDSYTSPMFNFIFGIPLKEAETVNHSLRVGVSHRTSWWTNSSFTYENRSRFDTLVSNQTGDSFFVDSVYTDEVLVKMHSQTVALDLSYIFRVNPNGRFSFYSGVGVEFGAVLNPRIQIERNTHSYFTSAVRNYQDGYEDYYKGSYDSREDWIRLDEGVFGQVYLPIGVDLRFSKFNPFWSKMHVYTEFRPSVQYVKMEGREEVIQSSFGMTALGLRLEF